MIWKPSPSPLALPSWNRCEPRCSRYAEEAIRLYLDELHDSGEPVPKADLCSLTLYQDAVSEKITEGAESDEYAGFVPALWAGGPEPFDVASSFSGVGCPDTLSKVRRLPSGVFSLSGARQAPRTVRTARTSRPWGPGLSR